MAIPSERQISSLMGGVRGVLLGGSMGLHTISPANGEYSLTIPQAFLFDEGKILGAAKVEVSGNIFEDLAREEITFACDELHPTELGFRLRKKVVQLRE